MGRLFIVTNQFEKICSLLLPIIDNKIEYFVISNEKEWESEKQKIKNDDILFSFSHSILIPKEILKKVKIAINVHAGPPSYPGRDIQHFAIYDGVKTHGATLHRMTDKVDAGDILDVEMFPVKERTTPSELHKMANEASYKLIFRNLPKILSGEDMIPIGVKWGEKKYTRKDFVEMCSVTPDMSKREIEKRIKIFSVPGYINIKTQIHGIWFYFLEKEIKS